MFFIFACFNDYFILHGVEHWQGCRLGRGTAYAVPKSLVQGCGVKRSVRTKSWSPACLRAVMSGLTQYIIILDHVGPFSWYPTTLLHHSWCFRTKQRVWSLIYIYGGQTTKSSLFSNVVAGGQKPGKSSLCFFLQAEWRILRHPFSWGRVFYVSHLSKEV